MQAIAVEDELIKPLDPAKQQGCEGALQPKALSSEHQHRQTSNTGLSKPATYSHLLPSSLCLAFTAGTPTLPLCVLYWHTTWNTHSKSPDP